MPSLSVADVTRIASAAVRQQSPEVEVVGVTLNTGGSDYVEIILEIRGCRPEVHPCELVVGVFRNVAELALQTEIQNMLRQHLAGHSPSSDSTK
jgi:hypothetical protein